MDDKKWRYCVIIYEVKERFKLSFEEYAYMDMIARQAAQFQSGWTNISQDTAAQILDVTDRSVRGYAKKLIAAGLIESEKIEGSYHTKKRATALWWKAINDSKKTAQEKFSATPEKTSDIPENFSNQPEKTSDNRNTYSNDYNNTTFSKEKGSSEKTEVFSPPTENKKIAANSNPKTGLFSQDENQTEKEKNCGKKEKAETPETEAKPTRKKFIPPTVEAVELYCQASGHFVDARRFVNYYASIGWKVGKAQNSMKDWQAAVRTWAGKDYNNNNQNNNNQNDKTNKSVTTDDVKRWREKQQQFDSLEC